MKGLAIVLLSAGLLLAGAPAAWADYSATDPDDSDTIDLATVSANRLTGARIRFRADFHETIRWGSIQSSRTTSTPGVEVAQTDTWRSGNRRAR